MAKKQVKTVKNDDIEIPAFINKNYQNQRKKNARNEKIMILRLRAITFLCLFILVCVLGYILGTMILPPLLKPFL